MARNGPRALVPFLAVLIVGVLGCLIWGIWPSDPAGANGLDVLWGPREGCYDLRSFGTGMVGDGAGTIVGDRWSR